MVMVMVMVMVAVAVTVTVDGDGDGDGNKNQQQAAEKGKRYHGCGCGDSKGGRFLGGRGGIRCSSKVIVAGTLLPSFHCRHHHFRRHWMDAG